VSYSIDTNVLLYASDETSRFFDPAQRFLSARVDDPDLLCLVWPTLMAYQRIATHPRIFAHPLSTTEAIENVAGLMTLPRARVIGEGDGFLGVYREVAQAVAARGNLVPDAHVAAILRQHGVRTIYSADADFRRFEFLEVRDPFRPTGGA
jgi:toxin-antitoxin system PIN domain toxin